MLTLILLLTVLYFSFQSDKLIFNWWTTKQATNLLTYGATGTTAFQLIVC